jgi:hypothetical protein
MLISGLVTTFSIFVSTLMSFLPASEGLSPEITTSFQSFISQALSWDYYIPVALGFNLLFLILGINFAIFVWQFIRYVYSAIRGAKV